MTAQRILFGLLVVVAAAAAVLSFAALRDLALRVRVRRRSWRGCCRWSSTPEPRPGRWSGSAVGPSGPARRFARALALGLLGLSVAANALGHGLAAYRLAPAWWVVVIVSAIAPAVLGAVVHLAVLVGRPDAALRRRSTTSTRDAVRGRHRSTRTACRSCWDDAPPRRHRPGGRADRRGSRSPPVVPRAGHHRVRGPPPDRAARPHHPRPTTPVPERSPVMNVPALLFLIVFAVVSRLAWRRGARALGLGCGALAVLFAVSVWRSSNPVALAVIVAVGRAGGLAALGPHLGHGDPLGSDDPPQVRRRVRVGHRPPPRHGRDAPPRRHPAPVAAPSATARERCEQLVAPAGRRGRGSAVPGRRGRACAPPSRRSCSSSAGPRMGKTQLLAGQIIDHPGAVIVTSTRTDLLDLTAPLRAQRGPVFVFNPVGLGDRPSTVTFDPLTGCANPVTAAERATDMLAAAGEGYGGRVGRSGVLGRPGPPQPRRAPARRRAGR